MPTETIKEGEQILQTGLIYLTEVTRPLMEQGLDYVPYLNMHRRGYWGDVSQARWQANDAAVRNGAIVASSYVTNGYGRIYIITEANRSYTTILGQDEGVDVDLVAV